MDRCLCIGVIAVSLLLATATTAQARESGGTMLAPCTAAQSASKTLAEKPVGQLPTGALVYRLETFPTIAVAQAAAGPLGVAAEAGSKAWLLTLGPAGGTSAGGATVTELGPLTIPSATTYTLRLQQRVSQPGCEGDAHTHPGAEAWYLLAGEQTIISSTGQARLIAGQGLVGPAPGAPMQLAYTGTAMTDALTFLILDGAQPASTPATITPATMPVTGGGYGNTNPPREGMGLLLVVLAAYGALVLGWGRGARQACRHEKRGSGH
jgi:hypothetical protein